MKTSSIQTLCGTIYGRDALRVQDVDLSMHPLYLEITTTLQLSACRPRQDNVKKEVTLVFRFSNVQNLQITPYDEFAYEKDLKSAFDKARVSDSDECDTYILSTYKYVIVVTGKYEIIYDE